MCSLLDHTHQLAVTAHEPDAPGQGPAFSAGCSRRLPSPRSIPHVGVLLGTRIREEVGLRPPERGGVAFAVQPHREVRPESGLVGIVEHIVVNKR